MIANINHSFSKTLEEGMAFLHKKAKRILKYFHILQKPRVAKVRKPRKNTAEEKIYKAEAEKYFAENCPIRAKKMGVSYNKIFVKAHKSRRGSCSSLGNLNFNCYLMKFPPHIIDYVIVHELAHLTEMNHSKDFRALVEKFYPDYKKAKQFLRNKQVGIE
ncbi:MAG TPA: M48 family metallopeptidase [Candidatus Absconditabacterales bacterium]|nr:M48 family metallopeptidase [Candidatus Absconditabacterales bacterium]HMT27052.1 M48 family metallopeptidase [Candidatus Absconditabacterales bacterium]